MNELPEKPADDTSGIVFSSSVKISDPETKEVLVEVRGEE